MIGVFFGVCLSSLFFDVCVPMYYVPVFYIGELIECDEWSCNCCVGLFLIHCRLIGIGLTLSHFDPSICLFG